MSAFDSAFFYDLGLVRTSRNYLVTVFTRLYSVFLPASDIPRFVGEGNVDLGITGQDQIRESQMSENVTELLKLGFGKCALQIQVPEESDIKTVDDLAGKRIATSFEVVAGEYFKDVDARAEARDGKKLESPTKIEYVGGSVEAACALGLSDGIGALIEFLLIFRTHLKLILIPYIFSTRRKVDLVGT